MDYSLVGSDRAVIRRTAAAHLSVGTLFTWLAVILLIAGVATDNIYQQHGDSDVPIVKDLSTHIGAFRACYNYRDRSGCNEIDRDCQVVFLNDFPDLSKTKIIHDCHKFNAARALLVLSIIIIGIAGLFQLLAALSASIAFNSIVGFILGILGSVCAIVSMSLFAAMRGDQDGLATNRADFDFSFVLFTVGWVMAFLSAFCFVAQPWIVNA